MRPFQSLFTRRRLWTLAAALFVIAGSLRAAPPFSLTPLNSVYEPVCAHATTGTVSYALSSALTGTTSGPIDLGLVGCFTFCVTGTGGAVVRLWHSGSATTYTAGTTNTAGTIAATFLMGGPNGQACYAFQKLGGRYVWFDLAPSTGVPYAPLGITPTAIKGSVFYTIPNLWPN